MVLSSTWWWLIVTLMVLVLSILIWLIIQRYRPDPDTLNLNVITSTYRPSTTDPLLSDTQGIIDMSYGDPLMYRPFWQEEASTLSHAMPDIGYDLLPNFTDTLLKLLAYVYHYHPDPSTLAIGNGSMQLLIGYIIAVKKVVSEPEHRMLKVALSRPTLPILPDFLSSLGGVEIVDLDYDGVIDLEYIITPTFTGNVPVPPQRGRYRLLDHAYGWPQYVSDPKELQRSVEGQGDHLFSLSKGVGFAGYRCGFATITDDNIRFLVQEYITTTTLGINTAGWDLGRQGIDKRERCRFDRALAYGALVLTERWRRLQAIGDVTLTNDHGAYAWFHRRPEQFVDIDVKVTRGSALLVSDEWSRVSMIGPQQTFDLFLCRLRRLPGNVTS